MLIFFSLKQWSTPLTKANRTSHSQLPAANHTAKPTAKEHPNSVKCYEVTWNKLLGFQQEAIEEIRLIAGH